MESVGLHHTLDLGLPDDWSIFKLGQEAPAGGADKAADVPSSSASSARGPLPDSVQSILGSKACGISFTKQFNHEMAP